MRALGPERAFTETGRIFDRKRTSAQQWRCKCESGDWREMHSDLPRLKIAPFDDKPRAPPNLTPQFVTRWAGLPRITIAAMIRNVFILLLLVWNSAETRK